MPTAVREIQWPAQPAHAAREGSRAVLRALRNERPKMPPRNFMLYADVLCLVFEELLGLSDHPDSFRDLASARLVCSSWNCAIRSCPSLWRYILVERPDLTPAPAFLATLRWLLARSGACLLTVYLELGGPFASPTLCTDICAAVVAHIGRLQAFSAVLGGEAQARALAQLDPARAPHLQSLVVGFAMSPVADDWYVPLAPGLFSGRRFLALVYTGLAVLRRPETVSLAELRRLILVDVQYVWEELEELLGLCPALEDLTLRGLDFALRGDPIPPGELELAVPLQRLVLDRVPWVYPNAYMFVGALERLPLRQTSEVELGRDFPFADEALLGTTVRILLQRLPVLDTLVLALDDDMFCLGGAFAESDDAVSAELARIVQLPRTRSKMALRCVQHTIRSTVATALLFEPLPAFARLSSLQLPLTFMAWRDNHTLTDALPGVVQLDLIYDARSFDQRVPMLPRLRSLRVVRLLRPAWRRRMVLTADKVAKLLGNYRLAYRPTLVLCGVQVIMLEHDLDRFVTCIIEEEEESH